MVDLDGNPEAERGLESRLVKAGKRSSRIGGLKLRRGDGQLPSVQRLIRRAVQAVHQIVEHATKINDQLAARAG